ncbi:hypothetical protein EHQ23_13160 [Leptospira bourretii]|uniref:Uncharacterized protein n=1 Tax=Leptospira bourretii TaxID=2484962 RepID=A0A4R9IR58_9LEPT|nr:hypothetical protein [Leptospira bourretii]TGK85585.1 hypothetical protein EHQ23_13160 [Leptospira bourretii]TGK94481.1 hypothetical protein EHQ26_00590 [Leptospira bourretii]TGL24838.1 hypothetical protein EHQ47_02520 [Leptospira bourretii]TGL33202.1 hypothetical protein EHQ45_11060 [Leptospira bourretii]
MEFTPYFQNEVLRKRPEIQIIWVIETFHSPDFMEIQEDGRIRLWKWIDHSQKYLRVIVLEDGFTFHNAFFDRGFKP